MELIDKIKDRFNEWVYNLWCKIGIKNEFHNRYLSAIGEKAIEIQRKNDKKKLMTNARIRKQASRRYKTIKRKKK